MSHPTDLAAMRAIASHVNMNLWLLRLIKPSHVPSNQRELSQ